MLRHIAGLLWWPLYALPLLAIVVLAVCGLSRSSTSHRCATASPPCWRTIPRWPRSAAYAIAVVDFTLAVLVDHVRLNDYDDRYLVLTNAFGPIGRHLDAVPGDSLAGSRSRPRRPGERAAGVRARRRRAARGGIPHVGSGSLHYQIRDQLAQVLVQRAPHGVLLGGYWETYVFTALQPPERRDDAGDMGRLLAHAVDARESPRSARGDCRLCEARPRSAATSIEMPPTLTQHGATLTLADGHWIENDYYQFGRYINTTPAPR